MVHEHSIDLPLFAGFLPVIVFLILAPDNRVIAIRCRSPRVRAYRVCYPRSMIRSQVGFIWVLP